MVRTVFLLLNELPSDLATLRAETGVELRQNWRGVSVLTGVDLRQNWRGVSVRLVPNYARPHCAYFA